MRLFVGVPIGGDPARRAGAVIAEWQDRTRRLAPNARVTWVAEERLHLTIRFIGAAETSRAATIADLLAPPLPLKAFDVVIAGTGVFPPRGTPRVFWAGIASGSDALRDVARVVTARLARADVAPETRPFSPHLTLGRVRDAAGLRSPDILAGYAGHPFGTSRVDAITLFESVLSPKGPMYRPLLHSPIGG